MHSAQRYRIRYRQQHVPSGYRGRVHLVFVFAFGATLIAALVAFAWPRIEARDWLVLPLTFVIANFVEYWAHRGPMHRRTRVLRPLFERHARRHHRYFTERDMSLTGAHDLHATLFPAVLLLFYGAIALGLGALVALVQPPQRAALFAAGALAYYLAYELLHLGYHLPPESPLARFPPVAWLGRLHRIHHGDPRTNFNLVAPLFDWVFGTLRLGVSPRGAIGQEPAARIG
jgi:sterol desaturase/sphingolipid hydroxylase (fatty acid hydroxylase superfamily)